MERYELLERAKRYARMIWFNPSSDDIALQYLEEIGKLKLTWDELFDLNLVVTTMVLRSKPGELGELAKRLLNDWEAQKRPTTQTPTDDDDDTVTTKEEPIKVDQPIVKVKQPIFKIKLQRKDGIWMVQGNEDSCDDQVVTTPPPAKKMRMMEVGESKPRIKSKMTTSAPLMRKSLMIAQARAACYQKSKNSRGCL